MEDVEIVALQQELEQERARVSDLEAERDSLREELEQTRARNQELQTENSETKKLNFTLARQLDTKPKKTFDETLVAMFGKGAINGH